MKRGRCTLAVAAFVAAVGTAGVNAAGAQTLQDRVDALEKKVEESNKTLTEKLGFELHGFVATSYNYNFNSPDSGTNRIHVFDTDHNSFLVDQANINIQRNVPAGLGFNIDLDFGKEAEILHSATWWSKNLSDNSTTQPFELRQAYAKYSIADTPFSVTAGKFVTFHGTEVLMAYNNFNYSISNSILFGYAIPFTHTGVFGTYAFPGTWGSLSLGAVNGWDDVVDNNSGKSVTGNLAITPPDSIVSVALAATYGAEQPHSNSLVRAGASKRLVLTPILTVKPTDKLTFIAEYDYGNESNIQLEQNRIDGVQAGTGTLIDSAGNKWWMGAAGYGIYQVTDALQIALRAEVFNDPDGVRTLYQETGYNPGITIWEVSPTVSYKITDGLTWRNEFRHDEADKRFFDNSNRTNPLGIRGQDLIETQLIYAF